MGTVLGIVIAGSVGALLRWQMNLFISKQIGDAFPVGIVVVNLLGCLLFGIAWQIAEIYPKNQAFIRDTILVGFLGSFTTFSTLAFLTYLQIQNAEWTKMVVLVLSHLVGGTVSIALGIRFVRFFLAA